MTSNRQPNSSGTIDLGDIEAGEIITFDVIIAPPITENFGYQGDVFTITGSNTTETFTVNTWAMVSSDLEGSVQFKVYNILGQAVNGAAIRLEQSGYPEGYLRH